MKKNQLILLLAALAVTGGAAFWKYYQRAGAIGTVPDEIGKDLLKDFNPAEVAAFTVKDSKGEVIVEQKDGKWIVPARDGFPASVTAVNELRDNAFALKIGEIQRVGDSRLGQLKLKKPGEGGSEEETGTVVSFRDSSGKEIKAFTAGKTLSNDDTPPGGFSMSPTGPKAQYIKVAGVEGIVYKARDGFSRLETDVKGWLDKENFVKIDKIKSVAVTGSEPAESWKISRDTEAGELKLEAPAAGEEFDAAKASPVGTAFSFVQFIDVLPAAEAAKAALDKPLRTAVIETFDGLTYTIKVGAADGDNHFMSYTVDGKFTETRTPPEPKEKDKPAETEEEKKKADEAFATALAAQKKKLADEQALQTRIYSLAKSSLEPILKKRSDFMKDKPAAATPAASPDFGAKPPLPGTPRIEAVTPPISVELPPAKKPKLEISPPEPLKPVLPKIEDPKVDAPKTETPKVEEAPKVEAPPAEAPKVEDPPAEAPKVEAPPAEAPKVEAPPTEAPPAEAPKTEAPPTAPAPAEPAKP